MESQEDLRKEPANSPHCPTGLSNGSEAESYDNELTIPSYADDPRRTSFTSATVPGSKDLDEGDVVASSPSGNASMAGNPESQKTAKRLLTLRQLEAKYNMAPGQIDWVKNTTRESFVSRISKHSSTTGVQISQAISHQSSDALIAPLCFLLEGARFLPDISWPELGNRVRNLLNREHANPNELNAEGLRPLHLAVEIGCAPAVYALLDHGADPNARTAGGTSVSAHAREQARLPGVAPDLEAHILWCSEIVKYHHITTSTFGDRILKSIVDDCGGKDAIESQIDFYNVCNVSEMQLPAKEQETIPLRPKQGQPLEVSTPVIMSHALHTRSAFELNRMSENAMTTKSQKGVPRGMVQPTCKTVDARTGTANGSATSSDFKHITDPDLTGHRPIFRILHHGEAGTQHDGHRMKLPFLRHMKSSPGALNEGHGVPNPGRKSVRKRALQVFDEFWHPPPKRSPARSLKSLQLEAASSAPF